MTWTGIEQSQNTIVLTQTENSNSGLLGSNTDDAVAIQSNESSGSCSECREDTTDDDEADTLGSLSQRGRKRNRNEDNWVRNQRQRLRNSGMEYVTRKGKRVPKKSPLPMVCKCRYHCKEFSQETRSLICDEFYAIGDSCRQKDFICSMISVEPVKRRVTLRKNQLRKIRGNSYIYSLKNGTSMLRVCQSFFCRTLAISTSVVQTALKNMGPVGNFVLAKNNRKGKNAPNKLDERRIEVVKEHINSFPRIEPHYCRKDTKKQYLCRDLSQAQMYRLYVEHCQERGIEPVRESMYRHIFVTEFNLRCFIPKKDQCTTCNKFQNADDQEKEHQRKDYEAHKEREKESMEEKEADKRRVKEDDSFHSVTFDLQALLSTPYAGDSQIYYRRKLSVYNFTVYANDSGKGQCYLWDETEGGRGPNEIGSALLDYMSNLPQTVAHFSSFSDTCGGQNRNQFIAAAMLYAVQKLPNLQTIHLKYMESGHSYLEVDSMHATIEKARKHQNIYTPREWEIIIKGAKKKGDPYNVKMMTHKQVWDMKDLAYNTIKNKTQNTGETVRWLDIKWLRFEKSAMNIIKYKYRLTSPHFMEIQVCSERIRRRSISDYELKSLYSTRLRITEAKKSDLIHLLMSGVIPKEYKSFYENLPSLPKN
ncbi:hypothetical protein HOLleu_01555 [Holothuria leucospilota]|uniref:DUF7869 domain-containing protein n=1 Tax=Holothuria leucospilota TaxID=206669 RepID=A0A9Q1CR02_HOLLE|nr:hypothetical protein HOLleu_01555 [Holothuria leucospilota]